MGVFDKPVKIYEIPKPIKAPQFTVPVKVPEPQRMPAPEREKVKVAR